jgi:hypothetical protein
MLRHERSTPQGPKALVWQEVFGLTIGRKDLFPFAVVVVPEQVPVVEFEVVRSYQCLECTVH